MPIKNETIEQVRLAHLSAKPTASNPAWLNTHNDLSKALKYIEELESKKPAIKRLDWNIFLDGQLWEAKALGGLYQVQESPIKEDNYFVRFYGSGGAVEISNAFGVDENQGMQLAQEHFENTVRECLENAN